MPYRHRVAAGALCAAMLTGCVSATEADPEPGAGGADASKQQAQRIQSAIADCMKQQGFKYVAWVPEQDVLEEFDKASSGDYEAMRRERSSHGFGVFDLLADPGGKRVVWSESDSPNHTIKNELSDAQRAAYDKALTSCGNAAIKQVTGKVVTSEADRAEQRNKLIDQTLERELNGEPRLVELAAAMGDCLKGKGYRVDSLKPVDLDRRGAREFEAQKRALAMKDDIPERDLPEGRYYEPRLPQATAKQYLGREIKASLDDLECGKDFYAAYLPRKRAISAQVGDLFGGGGI
ncbi:hypothetical protein AB0K12_15200 [Nonomuraea sp. NPDC049419]|uniref:hypothetical protein n=1 Tax=Nonomuraea sp. NPDC049419 TaxID=3155772 RepID=UPI0034436F94